MKNQKLSDWLILNRDSEGLAELLYELGERVTANEAIIMNNVRDDKCAKIECGKRNGLIAFKDFLLEPLKQTKTSPDT